MVLLLLLLIVQGEGMLLGLEGDRGRQLFNCVWGGVYVCVL